MGYELDGDHDVANLDGLVNSYEYAELLASNPSLADRFHFNGTDYLINRISDDWLATELSCGTVLWTSSAPTYTGGTEPYAPIRVVDVRACRD